MAEPTDRALVEFVRQVLRRDPSATPLQVQEAWQARRGGAVDEAERERLGELYAEEAAATREGRARRVTGGQLPGCGLVLVANVAVLALLAWIGANLREQASSVTFKLMVLIGLVQLVYVVPIGLWLRSGGQSSTLQGVIIGAAITFLLSAACFGLVQSFGWINR